MPRLLHYSDIENVYDDPERTGRLSGCVQSLSGDDALICGTGDTTSPGVLALVERGRQSLDFFRAVDADLDTFGNHDFDYGPEATRGVVADSPQTWVSANVYDDNSDRFAPTHVVPYTVREVNGARVGVTGVTDPATPSLNPMAGELTFTDPYAAAEEAIDHLRDEGVDYVVVLSHLGGGDDELAARVDADVILGGHVHSERHEYVEETLLLRPGANGHVVFEVELSDEEGADSRTKTRATATRHETADAPVDEALAEMLRGRVEAAELNDVVATVNDPLDRTEETVFGGECAIGNFVADAYRWSMETDVGLQNSGGIRNGPPLSGEVTIADLVSVIPFEEHVVVAELTGEELTAVFRECAAATVDFGEPHWWQGHLSGVELVWDDDREAVVSARVGGEPVAPDSTYTVATSDYVLHTDHEFPTIEAHHRAAEGDIQYEVLADYAREVGITSETDGRIQRLSETAADD
ncbi:bifunctional metallophosphatase/5'-nucleotidase [Halogeometricum borinquense]|uniref:Bifunctional metallophosphatase/5'-nucleotidase n=1 Tax=Halogeometricum borinquense TaxID=60847 RepID=A0A482TCE6_9EURY|nr:5'-nucleotidase C-terminal domain-containing protein [Halogeometricum borinquense]RYJ14567.1 bifunctional metallophosphatase/5'-nucleotidase [Halogeometricum borinquense]